LNKGLAPKGGETMAAAWEEGLRRIFIAAGVVLAFIAAITTAIVSSSRVGFDVLELIGSVLVGALTFGATLLLWLLVRWVIRGFSSRRKSE
jgi:uncharacterized membrane protein YdbT with pleckstrin-like domain